MKTIPFLILCFTLFPNLAIKASETVWSDHFQVPNPAVLKNPDNRNNIDQSISDRQSGSIAPKTYQANGQSWQTQIMYEARLQHSLLRMYPRKRGQQSSPIGLYVSPDFTLLPAPGTYVFGAKIDAFSLAQAEFPQLVFLSISDGSFDGDGAIHAVIDLGQEVATLKQGSRFLASADLPDEFSGESIILKWHQKEKGRITKLTLSSGELELVSTDELIHSENTSSKLYFGAALSDSQSTPQGYGNLSLLELSYTTVQ